MPKLLLVRTQAVPDPADLYSATRAFLGNILPGDTVRNVWRSEPTGWMPEFDPWLLDPTEYRIDMVPNPNGVGTAVNLHDMDTGAIMHQVNPGWPPHGRYRQSHPMELVQPGPARKKAAKLVARSIAKAYHAETRRQLQSPYLSERLLAVPRAGVPAGVRTSVIAPVIESMHVPASLGTKDDMDRCRR